MRTVLMRELPLVVFPRAPRATANPLEPEEVCVACCLKVNETVPCGHCGAPLCKRSCPNLDRHNIECAALKPLEHSPRRFMREATLKFGDMLFPTGLRMDAAILKDLFPHLDPFAELHGLVAVRIWKAFEQEHGPRLLNLQHEIAMPSSENGTVDAAKLKSAYENFLTSVSVPADVALSLLACKGSETRKGLERACGACLINSFVFKKEKYSGAALYSGLSLLEHSCLPNARVLPDGDSEEVLLIAARDIAAGEHVTINYDYEKLLPTRSERWLKNAFLGFVCRCELCEDPTDRGTHLNAWYCTTCK
ncbi:hypothetical protein FOCC_FOCC009402, partial [Frankliniella occidentalis]